ncbi:MAG: hypothetical protein MUF01_17435, partial [Bryobacterales bacterium]|nr:hypothetical protein [Bryobacterales bacterium]
KPLMSFPPEISFVKMSADEVHFRTMPKVDSTTKPEVKFVTNLVASRHRFAGLRHVISTIASSYPGLLSPGQRVAHGATGSDRVR